MKRIHLFEFHERPECPEFIRESVVEALGLGLKWGNLSAVLGPEFQRFVARVKATRVLDLCSGSGQPVSNLVRWLRGQTGPIPQFVLSDLFPNRAALQLSQAQNPDQIEVSVGPIDATDVSGELDHDSRMMVNAFHHFDDDHARAILADCAAKKKNIFIFESTPRGLGTFIRLGMSMPHVPIALLVNPFVAPRNKLLKFVFTYIVPLIPIAFSWDSVITNLRTYSKAELDALTQSIPNYEWTYREVPFGKGAIAVTYAGTPASEGEDRP